MSPLHWTRVRFRPLRWPLGLFPGFLAVSDAQAHVGSDLMPDAVWDVVLGVLALVVLGLLVLVVFWRYRAQLQRQLAEEREKAYLAVIQGRTMYQGLFDLAPVGIFRSSLDGSRYYAVNKAAADLYGVESPEKMIESVRPLDIYPNPGVRDEMVERLKRDGIVRNMEMRLFRHDGVELDVLVTIRLYAELGFLEGCVVDITEYRAAQKDIADKGRFLQALLDAMPNPLFYKTVDGRYRLVNEAFLDMLGMWPEDILDKSVYDIAPPELADRYHEMDDVLFKASGPAIQRYEAQVNGGQGLRDVVFNKQAVLDGEGGVEGLMGVITDITQVKRQKRELEEQRALMRTILDSVSEHIFFKDAHGTYLGCNQRFAASMDMVPDDFAGKGDDELFPPELAKRFRANDRLVLEQMKPITFDTEITLPHVGALIMETVLAPLFGTDGQAIGLVGVARDVTVRKTLEAELKAAEKRYRTLFENAVEGLFTVTLGGRIINANPALARLFGFDSVQELLREVNETGLELFEDPADRERLVEEVRREGQTRGFQTRALRRGGAHFWLELDVQGILDQNGELEFIDGIAKDVSQRRAAEKALRRKAATDPLTGLPNREGLHRNIAQMLAQAERSGEYVGVLFIDLDGFKAINDTWGHKVGDELLIQVAGRLTGRLRQSDMASRIGGDEFVVLLWDVKNAEAIRELGRIFVQCLTGRYLCAGHECHLSVSIGASLYPEHGQTMGELLERADKAMYAVKETGKNGFCLAGDEACPLLLEIEDADREASS